ncbi:MAG: hypothetical protein ABR548_09025 [Actinomycetota bacterium]|nr:ribbon-helix-helix domain-containing protein [Actinomycetota bacterium]
MAFKRTQIYLDPEEHRRLLREAAERGLSLTEYLRRVIAQRTAEQRVTYDATAWDGIFNLGNSGLKDAVEDMDKEVAEAFEAEYKRSLNRPATKSRQRKPGS